MKHCRNAAMLLGHPVPAERTATRPRGSIENDQDDSGGRCRLCHCNRLNREQHGDGLGRAILQPDLLRPLPAVLVHATRLDSGSAQASSYEEDVVG